MTSKPAFLHYGLRQVAQDNPVVVCWCFLLKSMGHRTPLDRRSAHGTWPLGGGGQRRARCGTRVHRTRQHAHQPSATLATDALERRLT